MATRRSSRGSTKRAKVGPRAYGDYSGPAPRISLVLTPLDEQNLGLAAQVRLEICFRFIFQIGVTDIVYYNMDEMPSTAEDLKRIRAVWLTPCLTDWTAS